MKFTTKLQFHALFIHIFSIIGLYYFWDPIYFIFTAIGYFLFMIVGHHIGVHRYFSHRSFKTTRTWEIIFTVLSWFSTRGSVLGFCAAHHIHHANSDTEKDPHPSKDIWKTWFWFDNPVSYTVPIKLSGMKNLLRKPEQIFMRDYYFSVYWAAIILFVLLFGFKFVLYFFLVTGILGFHTAGMVNVLSHRFGYRNFKINDVDTSTNLPWLNYLTMGGGLHNNHHAYPGSWTCKFREGEWDPSAWMIKHIFATNPEQLVSPNLIGKNHRAKATDIPRLQ